MHYHVLLKYICSNIPIFFLSSLSLFKNITILFIPSFSISYITIYLKYSFFFKNFYLLDLGVYEIPMLCNKLSIGFKNIIWYIFKNSLDYSIFLFSTIDAYSVSSIELFFRNARWLEREASDFFNIFFKCKGDRRSLFTIPLFYEAPFRKKYPVVGFYELFICFFTKKIKFKHISFKN